MLERIYERYSRLLIYCFEFSVIIVALVFSYASRLGITKKVMLIIAIITTLLYIIVCVVIVDAITKKKMKKYLTKVSYPIMEVKMCKCLNYVMHEDYIDVRVLVTNLRVYGREL